MKNSTKICLQNIQKPQTLIVIHYEGKRLSCPIFESNSNLAEQLFGALQKFERQILHRNSKHNLELIKCFQVHPIKPSSTVKDNELRANIVLSQLRPQSGSPNLAKLFRYVEVSPFYIKPSNEQYSGFVQDPSFNVFRILQETPLWVKYLVRRNEDGHFYTMKVYSTNSKCGKSEESVLFQFRIKPEMDCCLPMYFFSDVIRVSSNDLQQVIITPFAARGTLRHIISSSTRIPEKTILWMLKRLIWSLSILHNRYSLIHRNITPDTIEINELLYPVITDFGSCVKVDKNGVLDFKARNRIYAESYDDDLDIYMQFETADHNGPYNIGIYTAPQVYQKGVYGRTVDYYSLGMTFNELFEQCGGSKVSPSSVQTEQLHQQINYIVSQLISQQVGNRENIVELVLQALRHDSQEANDAKEQEPPLKSLKTYSKSSMDRDMKAPRPTYQLLVPLNSLAEIYVGKPIDQQQLSFVTNEVSISSIHQIDHKKVMDAFSRKMPDQLLETQHNIRPRSKGKNKSKSHNSRGASPAAAHNSLHRDKIPQYRGQNDGLCLPPRTSSAKASQIKCRPSSKLDSSNYSKHQDSSSSKAKSKSKSKSKSHSNTLHTKMKEKSKG